ncbi:unnamed protein product [Staurois parvus]|uniref:Uncharacterized protein n=1 Tax=Staurois parvus TaxID=386267 RepID=A0ABN9FBF6_9NEOB|nr:unnamed protein product [Staurois parvus]
MHGSGSAQHGNRQCAVSQWITNQWKEPKMSAQSCDQLCPITANRVSATCQCSSVPAVGAHSCHLPVPHQCHISVPTSAHQCPSELPFSVTHQCQSVPPINASQCHLSVLPISAASQCRLYVCISTT